MPALASAVSRAPVLHTHYHAGQRPFPPLPWDENKPTGAHCIADLSWPACVHDSDSQRLCAAARVFLLYCAGWQRPLPQQRPVVRPTATSPHLTSPHLASRARPPVAQMHTMRHRRSVHEHPHGPTQTMIRIAQSSQLTSCVFSRTLSIVSRKPQAVPAGLRRAADGNRRRLGRQRHEALQ